MSAPPKVLRRGTHRARTPRQTLAWVLSLMPAMGITRLAGLTGLDTIGLPVFAAVRPNSRTVSVHQGKGLTDDAACCSALMEAAEAFHAETVNLPLRLATPQELGPTALDVARLPRARGAADPHGTRLLWVEGRRLPDGAPRWVPLELVAADYTWPQPAGAGLFQATTNGLGAGNTRAEAIVHALCEVVERDAIALWRAGFPGSRARRAIDPRAVDDDAQDLTERLAAAGCAVRLWDVTSDVGIPVVVCLIAPADDTDGTEPELGSGCHPDPAVAVLRAITEAAQARLTRISGARDDFEPASYDAPAASARRRAARDWLRQGGTALANLPPDRSGDSAEADVATVTAGLAAAGIGAPVVVALDQPQLGIPVVRVVVPDLEGPWTDGSGAYVPGGRAARAGGG